MFFKNHKSIKVLKPRLTAAGWHFLASAVVVSLFMGIVYFVWYPKPFFIIHSVFDAVKIVLVVDLILGPFLTFVIYNTLKPRAELFRDISFIVILQIVALGWGAHITYKMRPDFLVYYDSTFYSILKSEINAEKLKQVKPPAIWQRPKAVYVQPLKSEVALQRLDKILKGGDIVGVMYMADKYRPLSMTIGGEHMQDIINSATSYTILLKSKTWQKKVETFLKRNNGKGDDFLFYSLENATDFSGIIIFNKQDFTFAGLMKYR